MADVDIITITRPNQRKRREVPPPCKMEGCDKLAWAQGYCDPHYQKLKREGVLQNQRVMKDDLARFHTKYEVNAVTGCWEWIGAMHPHGYGQFGITVNGKGVNVRAHRFAYANLVEPIPAGMQVLHRCDNRGCVRPSDLFLGDNSVNVQDCLAKGRHVTQTAGSSTKITPAMALNVRVMYARGLVENGKGCSSLLDLSRLFSVHEETIRGVVKGNSHLKV